MNPCPPNQGKIRTIVLTPEDGTLRVDLRGELAAILGLCADSKKPGAVSGAGLLEQVKMVAGARNRLCLLITAERLHTLR